MRILIVSGIWPPDVGGPASHAPELGAYLQVSGHDVRAVTTRGERAPEAAGFPVRAARRDRPRLLRQPAGGIAVMRSAGGIDIIYSTGMYTRSTVAAAVHRRPLVVKLASDPAYERSRTLGLFTGTLEEFQHAQLPRAARQLRMMRNLVVRRASRLIVPSRFLAEFVRGWGVEEKRVRVVPNPAPPPTNGAERADLRRRLGFEGPTFVFAGRLVAAKNVPLAVSALSRVPAASLVVIGEGSERDRVLEAIARHGLERRVSLIGALPRAEAIEWVRAADAAVLSSDYENHPHAAVEAIAVGTPVLATSVGGVPEIIVSGENGMLSERGDEEGLARAMTALVTEPGLRERLSKGASASAARFDPAELFGVIERELELAVRQQRA